MSGKSSLEAGKERLEAYLSECMIDFGKKEK